MPHLNSMKPSAGRIGKLRVGLRRAEWPPPWLKVYEPPADQPDPAPAGGEGPADAPSPPAIPDRSVWRSVLATWPIPDRQRWGEMANAYEAQGDAWNEAEWKAFNACNDAG